MKPEAYTDIDHLKLIVRLVDHIDRRLEALPE